MRDIQEPTSERVERYGGEEIREDHPAFGVITVTRGTGTPRTLFQSDIQHNETITLAIMTADRTRTLNRDWVHSKKTLVEVEMSLAQWGAVVSSMGIGSGTPVTIRSTESNYRVPGLPFAPRIAENLAEVKDAFKKTFGLVAKSFQDVEDAFEQKKGVKAMRGAINSMRSALQTVPNNAAFAVSSLQEAAEHVTSQAKADIEAHILTAAQLTGVSPIEQPELPEITIPTPEIEQ